MKEFIAVDENNIVRCKATERGNIHPDKEDMDLYYVECGGFVGDEYDANTDTWTPHPENYPKPTEAQVIEAKIKAEEKVLQRTQAIQSLKDRGELPADYNDTI